jgi:hypothetical protein
MGMDNDDHRSILRSQPDNDNQRPTRRITKAEVIPWDEEKGTWGVRFEFDDGTEDFGYSIPRETAKWDAYDRIGEEMPVGMYPLLRSADRMETLKERRRKQSP